MADTHLSDEDLHALLDGELDPTQQRALQLHLGSCRQCTRRLQRLRGLFALIESVPEAAYEGDLSGPVLRSLAVRPLPRWAVLEAGLATAMATLAGLWLSRSGWASEWAEGMQGWTGSAMERLIASVVGLQAQLDGALRGLQITPNLAPGLAPIPGTQLWLLAGSALLLWAVGNAMLLRGQAGEERR